MTVELEKEFNYYAEAELQVISTIYLGGGTPSLLSPNHIKQIFDFIEKRFPNYRETVEEVCIETAPDTVTERKFKEYINLGINRVNLGAQTFLDDELYSIGRKHPVNISRQAIELLKTGNVTEISLDHDLGDDDRGTGYDVVLWIEEAVIIRGFIPAMI